MPLATWAACWAPSFDIANDGCPAEQPPVVTVDAPLRAVRPGATWSATIDNGGPDRPTVVKTGPALVHRLPRSGRLRRPGDVTVPRLYDAPLPEAEGVYVLCAARTDADGAPSTADAGLRGDAGRRHAARRPDRALAVVERCLGVPASSRSSPHRSTPSFLVKAGPAGTVDCAAEEGYAVYLRIPVMLTAAELPATLCVIGEDEAGNRGAPQSFPGPRERGSAPGH